MGWRQSQGQQTKRNAAMSASAGPVVQQVLGKARDAAMRGSQEPTQALPLQTWCAQVFDLIEWRRFEAVVEALFGQAGFDTRTQPCGADGGIDIWLHSRSQGGAAVSVVQCKHWTSWKVGVKPVRELRGVMAAHDIARGQFVTTSGYTTDAQAFASENGIMLHDTVGLLALIASRTATERQHLLQVAFEGDYWRPTCASCGIKLVERRARASGDAFWGCENYPKCKSTMAFRTRHTS